MLEFLDLYNYDFLKMYYTYFYDTNTIVIDDINSLKKLNYIQHEHKIKLSLSNYSMYYGDIVSSRFKIIEIDCNESQSYFSDYYLPNLKSLVLTNYQNNIQLNIKDNVKLIYKYIDNCNDVVLDDTIKHLQLFNIKHLPSFKNIKLKSLQIQTCKEWLSKLKYQDELEVLMINSNMINSTSVKQINKLKSLKFVIIQIITVNEDVLSVIEYLLDLNIKIGLYSLFDIFNIQSYKEFYKQLNDRSDISISSYDELQIVINKTFNCIESNKLLKYCDCVLCKPLGTYEGKGKLVVCKGDDIPIDTKSLTILGSKESYKYKEYTITNVTDDLIIYESGTYIITSTINVDVRTSNVTLIINNDVATITYYGSLNIELLCNMTFFELKSYTNDTINIKVHNKCKKIKHINTNNYNIKFECHSLLIHLYTLIHNSANTNSISNIDYRNKNIEIIKYNIILKDLTDIIPLLLIKNMNYTLLITNFKLIKDTSLLYLKCKQYNLEYMCN